MHPDTPVTIGSLFSKSLSILHRFGFSRRAAQRRRALADLRYASEYFKYDIGFYGALLKSPDEEMARQVALAPSPVSTSSALEQPSLLSCQRA